MLPDGGIAPLPDACATGTGICESFDQAASVGALGWTPIGSGLSLSTEARSQPHSLLAQSSTAAKDTFLQHSITITSRGTCDFDLMLDSWSGSGRVFLLRNSTWGAPDNWELALERDNGRMMFVQYALTSGTERAQYPNEDPPQANVWLHVHVAFALGGAATLDVTGVPQLKADPPVPAPKTTTFDLMLGIRGGSARVQFDNVVCSVQ